MRLSSCGTTTKHRVDILLFYNPQKINNDPVKHVFVCKYQLISCRPGPFSDRPEINE